MIPTAADLDLEKVPDRAVFYYMHDNHTFTPLEEPALDLILIKATKLARESPHGMLCPVILLHGEKEIRRVGPCVHHNEHGLDSWMVEWSEGCQAWKREVSQDPDVVRILQGKESPVEVEHKRRLRVFSEIGLGLGCVLGAVITVVEKVQATIFFSAGALLLSLGTLGAWKLWKRHNPE